MITTCNTPKVEFNSKLKQNSLIMIKRRNTYEINMAVKDLLDRNFELVDSGNYKGYGNQVDTYWAKLRVLTK